MSASQDLLENAKTAQAGSWYAAHFDTKVDEAGDWDEFPISGDALRHAENFYDKPARKVAAESYIHTGFEAGAL